MSEIFLADRKESQMKEQLIAMPTQKGHNGLASL
jgi:hypothetical protein